MSQSVLAVIPARGGSKRIPDKNLRELGNKPLIAHTIAQVHAAERINRAIVSTDSDDIAEVAQSYGGDVPFSRPPELATDSASSDDVVAHALEWCQNQGDNYDVVAKIQVTTPLRTIDDIDSALERMVAENATSVVSVTEFDTPPFWAMEMKDSRLEPYFEENYLWTDEGIPPSQHLPKLLYPNGAIFASDVETFRQSINFYTVDTIGYEMPPERSVDIDEPFELKLVEALVDSGVVELNQ